LQEAYGYLEHAFWIDKETKMKFSRRALAFLPALALLDKTAAQDSRSEPASNTRPVPILDGKIYDVSARPWRNNANGASKMRAIFNGFTTRGQHLTMHMTELEGGQAPHPAARQPHEEVLIIQQGTIECTINGETATLGPGSVVYSGYNNLRDWKNVGNGPATYFVISLEDHK
jgi:mannose-6-phosphate isomerase-like protein (cupin superfamily)